MMPVGWEDGCWHNSGQQEYGRAPQLSSARQAQSTNRTPQTFGLRTSSEQHLPGSQLSCISSRAGIRTARRKFYELSVHLAK